MWESRDLILEFCNPPSVSSNEKNSKLGQKKSCGGHVNKFWNFGTPLISRERLKLETSNLARRRKTVSFNEKKSKLGQKGSCGGHATQFWNFGTPIISRERVEARKFKFGTETDGGEL